MKIKEGTLKLGDASRYLKNSQSIEENIACIILMSSYERMGNPDWLIDRTPLENLRELDQRNAQLVLDRSECIKKYFAYSEENFNILFECAR